MRGGPLSVSKLLGSDQPEISIYAAAHADDLSASSQMPAPTAARPERPSLSKYVEDLLWPSMLSTDFQSPGAAHRVLLVGLKGGVPSPVVRAVLHPDLEDAAHTIIVVAGQLVANGQRLGPFPPFMRPIPVEFGPPIGKKPMGSYAIDVVFTRDTWMHRIDVCRAVGLDPVVTASQDGRAIEDMVAEWARVHGLAFTLHLDGPAGGTFVSGSGGDELTIDAVEWIWILSGRGTGSGLLEKELPL
jgi:hypothetical protein